MLPQDHFLTGLLCFLVAHGCYLVAFTLDCRFAAKPLPLVFWSGVEIARDLELGLKRAMGVGCEFDPIAEKGCP